MKEFTIVGRKNPQPNELEPKLYQMCIFAKNDVIAKSKFWYFLRKLKKIKKTGGEIVHCSEVIEPEPIKPKNYGIWIRLQRQEKVDNMYKEYRETSRPLAVRACYMDLASMHKAKSENVQIVDIRELSKDQLKKPSIIQLNDPNLKFPLIRKKTPFNFLTYNPKKFINL